MKMPSTPASTATVTAIKWTDEEWVRIAAHLYAVQGPNLFQSENIEAVKARDVFDAQTAVLPPERHRKLISLAQGFQAIRTRLRTILENQARSPVPHVTPAASPPEDKSATSEQSRANMQAEGQQALFSTDRAAIVTELNKTVVRPPVPSTELEEAGENGYERENPSSDFHVSRIQAVADNKSDISETDLSEQLIAAAAGVQARGKHMIPEKRPVTHPASKELPGGRNGLRQAEVPVTSSVMEQMRPFISMVCEELTQALVKTMSEKGNSKLLSAFMRSVATQASPPKTMWTSNVEIREGHQGGQGKADFQRNDEASVPAFILHDIEDEGMAEEEDLHEPQPLFDPKLPPSAMSDFKPTIGLVGADTHQAIELQTQYPQLQLIVVSADAVKVGRPFQRCQRVIGMKEGVPMPVEEFLGRILRHRYVRISGGVGRVQEQLNAWLNGSAGFNMRPEKPGPRGNKGARNLYANKRPNRFRTE